MRLFLWGISCAGAIIGALCFLRFWQQTRDRLFILFAIAFAIFAAQWALLALFSSTEHAAEQYSLRIAAFALIAIGIVDKNRRAG